MTKKPSEIIVDFLKLLETAELEHRRAFKTVGIEDKRVQDFLHEFEFAKNKAERNKAATRLQQSRRARRSAKDTVDLYEHVLKFAGNSSHKLAIRDLSTTLGLQKKQEEYLVGPREYKERVNETEHNS